MAAKIPTKAERDANLDTLQSETKKWADEEIKRLDNEAKFMRAVIKGRTGSAELGALNLFEASKILQVEIDSFILSNG